MFSMTVRKSPLRVEVVVVVTLTGTVVAGVVLNGMGGKGLGERDSLGDRDTWMSGE
jgi:hypothetical protein